MAKWCLNYESGDYEWIDRDGFSIDRGEYVYNWDDSEYRREEERHQEEEDQRREEERRWEEKEERHREKRSTTGNILVRYFGHLVSKSRVLR